MMGDKKAYLFITVEVLVAIQSPPPTFLGGLCGHSGRNAMFLLRTTVVWSFVLFAGNCADQGRLFEDMPLLA